MLCPVAGGGLAASFRADLDDGRTIFIKTYQHPPDGFFTTEATGLFWLRSTGTILVPEVIAVGDKPPFLVVEWIDSGSADTATDDHFGRVLARHHLAGFEIFGRPDNKATDSQAMNNQSSETWSEFYALRRIIPLTAKAADNNSIASTTAAKLDMLVDKMDVIVGPGEPPVCLHGDLWAGNRMIDPPIAQIETLVSLRLWLSRPST